MHHNPSLRRFMVILTLALVVLLTGGAWFYHTQEQQLRQRAEDELQAVAQLKVSEITAWRAERLGDAAVLAEGPFFAKGVARWMANPQVEPSEEILAQFRTLQKAYHYYDILLVDADGHVRLSLSGYLNPLNEDAAQVLTAALHDGQPMLTDLHLGPGDLPPHIDAIAPLFTNNDSSAEPIGAIILQSDASQFLYPLIQHWPTPSNSAETLLVRRDGDSVLYLNALRYRPEAALILRIPLTQTDVPAVKAVLGTEGVVQGRDYRGVEVLSALRPVPDSSWFVVAKVDKSEIFADWHLRSLLILGMILGELVAVGMVWGAVWQRNQKVHYQTLFKAEKAQQESETRYQTTLLSIGDGVIATDAKGSVILLNPVAEALTGWSHVEAHAQPLEEVFRIINEETHQPVESPVSRVIREGLIVGLANHTLLVAKDGRETPIADSGAPVHDTEGNLMGVVLVFRDQTEERMAHKALTASETRYRRLFEAAQDGILILDASTGQVLEVNPFLVNLLGYSREALLGEKLWEIGLFQDIAASQTAFLELKGNGYIRYEDLPLETRDGRRIEVEFVSNVYLVNDEKVIQCNIRDITARKRVEEALRESEVRFRRVVADAPFPMLIHAENGEIIMVSETWTEITGYSHADIPTIAAWTELAYGERKEIIQADIDRLYSLQGRLVEGEYVIRTRSGEQRIWDFNSSPVGRLSDGRRLVLSMAMDVTERKRSEEAIRLSEARYRSLIENQSDAIARSDLLGNLTFVNDAYCRAFGTSREELLGASFIPNVLPEDLPITLNALQEIRVSPYRKQTETRHLTPAGIRWFSWENSAVVDERGNVIELQGIGRDITERKWAEVALEKQFRALRFLHEIAVEIEGELEVSALLHNIMVRAVDLSQAGRGGGLYLYNADENILRMVEGSGINKDRVGCTVALNEGVAGRVFRTSQPFVIDDYTHWEEHATILVSSPPSTIMGIPLFIKGQVVGVLTLIADSSQRTFTEEDVHLTEMFTAQVSIAIQNAKLYEKAQQEITERKRVEEALRKSERELTRAQSIGGLGNWNWDIAENALTWSDEVYHLFGVEKEHFALTYENIENRIHPDDRATNSAMVAQLPNSAGQMTWEFRIIQPNGTVRWIHQIVEIARNSSGQPITAFGTMQDITERKRAEDALRELERFARATLDGLSAHIAILDETGTILAVNDSWRAFAEDNPPVAANVSEGANYLAVCDQASGPSSEGAAEFAAAIRAVLGGKLGNFEAEHACHSPTEQRWFVGRVTRFPGEGPVRVVVAHENITRSKLAELKLAEERNLLRTLIDNLPDRVYAKDTEGRFILKNLADTRPMGAASTDEVVGKTDFDYYPPELAAQYQADDRAVLQSGQPLINWEEPVTMADGTQGWILTSKVPLRDDQGNVIGLVGIGHDITGRKQAEETLRKLSHAVEHSPSIIYITDSDGRIEYVNPKFTEVTGYTVAEAPGQIPRVLDPDMISLEEYEERWNTIRSGHEWRGEFHNRKKNGERFWESVAISSIKDAGGALVHFVLVMEDITERKRAEDAERDQRILAEALRDTAAALTNTLDPDVVLARILENVGRVMPHDYASIMIIEGEVARPVYCRGWQPDEETAFRALRFPLETQNLREMVITGRPVVIPDTVEYSGWVPVTPHIRSYIGAPIRSHDRVIGFLDLLSTEPGFFTAIHADRLGAFADQAATAIENAQLYDELRHYSNELEQRVVERTAQLNHAKERIEAILNSSSDVMILCRTNSLIDQVNPAFDTRFRCGPDEIYNLPLATLAVPGQVSLLEQTFETVVQTRQPQRLEITVRYKTSAPFDSEMMLSPVVGSDQQLFGVICSLRDITERKKMEDQLRQMLEHEMELSELRSRYVSMAAHDLRNPLAAIKTAVEVIERYHDRLTEGQRQAKYDGIHRSIEAMIQLLNDTLTIGQAESGKLKFEPGLLDLITFSHDLVAELGQATGSTHRINFSHQGLCDAVHMDPKLLRHILSNLLSNAFKYSPADSAVTFEVQCESNTVTFCIRDQGIGIPPADQTRLFEAFHRADNVGSTPGTGLGLAIVKQSVDLHGGTISFESEEGVGTAFTVIIPSSFEE